MIDHTGIGVADVGGSSAFYDGALGALGLRRVMQVFWIDRFHPHGVKQQTAFAARSCAEVDAFYASAMKAAGIDEP